MIPVHSLSRALSLTSQVLPGSPALLQEAALSPYASDEVMPEDLEEGGI